jgi:xanthosine utilization system XapX-like protein
MVEPSVSDEDREAFLVKFRIGFALFVGVSMALVALSVGAPLPTIAAIGAVGSVAGAILGWWVFPDSIALGYAGRRR